MGAPANAERHRLLDGLGTQTKKSTIDDEVSQVSCFKTATHNDTVGCNPLALTKRNCKMYRAEDKRWKHLIDATFGKEPDEQIVMTNKKGSFANRHVC